MSKERLLKANGQEMYGGLIDRKVRKEHPKGDENAILRKALYAIGMAIARQTGENPLPQEFLDYYTEVETIKALTKRECGLDE